MKLVATASFGLEVFVSREFAALGYPSKVGRPGWLTFEGNEATFLTIGISGISQRGHGEPKRSPHEPFPKTFETARSTAVGTCPEAIRNT